MNIIISASSTAPVDSLTLDDVGRE